MVGAYRQLAFGIRRRQIPRQIQEIYDINRGKTLGQMLPSELLALKNPLRKRDFLRRYLEAGLLEYDLRGEDTLGKGPLVICLDVSGSMGGDKELWAKAVALTLLEICRRQHRQFLAILFGSAEDPRKIYRPLLARRSSGGRQALDSQEVLRLAEFFIGGGTDFEQPLQEALAELAKAPLKGGDLVLLTDGECQVGEVFLEHSNQAKKNLDVKIHVILVDKGGTSRKDSLAGFADSVTLISQLSALSAKEIFLKF